MAQHPTARMELPNIREYAHFKLQQHHHTRGEDAWIPVPDLAALMGVSNPEPVEAAIREMAAEQLVVTDSCKLRGFEADEYRRKGEKGWWPCVKLLPPAVVEARRRAAKEHAEAMERGRVLVQEALEVQFGAAIRARVEPDGRITLLAADDDDAAHALKAVLAAARPTTEAELRPAPVRERERDHPRKPAARAGGR